MTPPAPTTPWFWSDQYDAKLQIAGLRSGVTSTVMRGDPESGSFAIVHLTGDRIACVEAMNAAVDFAIGRRLISTGAVIDPSAIADAVSLFDAVVDS